MTLNGPLDWCEVVVSAANETTTTSQRVSSPTDSVNLPPYNFKDGRKTLTIQSLTEKGFALADELK